MKEFQNKGVNKMSNIPILRIRFREGVRISCVSNMLILESDHQQDQVDIFTLEAIGDNAIVLRRGFLFNTLEMKDDSISFVWWNRNKRINNFVCLLKKHVFAVEDVVSGKLVWAYTQG